MESLLSGVTISVPEICILESSNTTQIRVTILNVKFSPPFVSLMCVSSDTRWGTPSTGLLVAAFGIGITHLSAWGTFPVSSLSQIPRVTVLSLGLIKGVSKLSLVQVIGKLRCISYEGKLPQPLQWLTDQGIQLSFFKCFFFVMLIVGSW